MQVGSRFSQGETPRGVSDDFASHLRQVEAELTPEESTWRWTLTWLERRPVATLDNGTVVRG